MADEGQLIFRSSGLTAAVKDAAVHIQILDSGASGCGADWAAGLHAILDHTPPGLGWVVDLSGLEGLPLSLVNELLSYQHRLKAQGRPFRLVGAGAGLFPKPRVKPLAQEGSGLDERGSKRLRSSPGDD